jgi:hypothetical protein
MKVFGGIFEHFHRSIYFQDIVVALSLSGGTLRHRMVNEGQMWILQVNVGHRWKIFRWSKPRVKLDSSVFF